MTLKLNIKSKRGQVILILVYLLVAVLLTFSVIFVNRTINEKNIAMRQKNIALAFYLAEAGLDSGLVWLRDRPSPPSGTEPVPLGDLEGPQALGDGIYSISIDPDDDNPISYLKRYRIISTGTVGDITKTLVNEVQSESYARFTFFTDSEIFRWGPLRLRVWFINGDILKGPVQTNGNFNIYRNPVFNGEVKSAEDYITFFNNGNYLNTSATSNPPNDIPDFQQGIDLGVEEIEMPSKALDLRTAAVQGGLQLQGPTTVVLNADGTMNVTNAQQGWNNQNMPLPSNGALFVEGGDLTVSGTLDGRLTLGANRDIIVNNNITYADDPQVNPNSDDMLGIIAERDVVISQNAPYDVEVNGSIMALGNSFMVENWWQGPPKGTLTTYGGIIERDRGPVGTFSGGSRASGYSKDYNYDPRLVSSPPPFYPTTGDYISLSWKE